MNHCTVRQTKFGVSFESLFCLTKLLNMAMVRNFEVVFRQTLNRFV
jgi:hypothetical protein